MGLRHWVRDGVMGCGQCKGQGRSYVWGQGWMGRGRDGVRAGLMYGVRAAVIVWGPELGAWLGMVGARAGVRAGARAGGGEHAGCRAGGAVGDQ